MLDRKFIRENVDLVKQSLIDRNLKLDLDEFISLDESRRKFLTEIEDLRSKQNKANDQISSLLKEKKDAKPVIASMKETDRKSVV